MSAEQYVFSVIANWASWNDMKVHDEVVTIDGYGETYELDVQYNDDLMLKLTPRKKRAVLRNGERKIGKARFAEYLGEPCVIIQPEIQDR